MWETKNHFGFHDFVPRPWPIVHSKYIDWLPGTSSTILFVSLVRFMLFCALWRSINKFFKFSCGHFPGRNLDVDTNCCYFGPHEQSPWVRCHLGDLCICIFLHAWSVSKNFRHGFSRLLHLRLELLWLYCYWSFLDWTSGGNSWSLVFPGSRQTFAVIQILIM